MNDYVDDSYILDDNCPSCGNLSCIVGFDVNNKVIALECIGPCCHCDNVECIDEVICNVHKKKL